MTPLENKGKDLYRLKLCMALVYVEKYYQCSLEYLHPSDAFSSNDLLVILCGDLVTQKGQSCSDSCLLLPSPTISSKHEKKILKLFPGFKKYIYSMFIYVLLNLGLRMPWQVSFIF